MELTFESIFLRVCHDGTMLLVWFQTVPSTPYYEHIDHCHSPNVCDDACFFNKPDGWAYHGRNKGCICCSRLFCNHQRTEYVYFISNNYLRACGTFKFLVPRVLGQLRALIIQLSQKLWDIQTS
jgi:hypothetical protein